MYTVSYRIYNKRLNRWDHDTIEEEDFSEAMKHFTWFTELSEDPDVTESRVYLSAEKHTCARYTKSNDPVW